jgi:Surface glycan-binding protein B xyloglucan binding domain
MKYKILSLLNVTDTFKVSVTCALFFIITSSVFAQKTAFVQAKTQELYAETTTETEPNINGFKAVVLFDNDFDNTVWVSPEKQCVTMTKEYAQTYSGEAALHVKWDKIAGGCKWLGIGFGWNNWQPKDMLDVVAESALQFQVKSVKGTFSNLPVAFAFEDYSGVQSYYGFNKTLVTGDFTATEWRTVTVPLRNFPFENNDADLAKIKQFIIQLEGDGDIYLDDIRIVQMAHP